MKKILSPRALLLLTLTFTLACTFYVADARSQVRKAAVAGSFYPADPAQLTSMIDGFLARAFVPEIKAPVVALVVPHAGYQFSGPTAAHSFALLRGRTYARVIVIAPSHVEAFGYTSVYNGDAYATPLGEIPVDKDFVRRLAAADRSIRMAGAGHSVGQQGEHALEVELPFLQRTISNFRLVPIVMGDQSYASSRALGIALATLLKNDRGTLIVASSDLSHFHPYDEAKDLDRHLLDAVTQNDFLTVSRNTESRTWEACGAAPVVAAMIAAERLGASAPRLLAYANSGDVTGDRSRVVGYSAVAFLRDNQPQRASDQIALTPADRTELLRIARTAVETAVRERKAYEPPVPQSPALLAERGAFVTLNERGELRGCIGYVAPMRPLYLAVRDVAVSAALRDSRFPQVRAGELPQLEYEISVLSPFRHELDPGRVRVGEHGLLIKQGHYEGVLLPQVPVEQRWDRETFLRQASIKAGLAPDAWQDPLTDVFSFTAYVFNERGTKLTNDNGDRPPSTEATAAGSPPQ